MQFFQLFFGVPFASAQDNLPILVDYSLITITLVSEHSQVANAKFQAASAIRDAAIREWGFLSAEDKRSLIVYVCRHFILFCGPISVYIFVFFFFFIFIFYSYLSTYK